MSKRKKREQRAARTLSGELHMARNGAGYLIDPATDAAVWIEAKDLSTALPGDIVAVNGRVFVSVSKYCRDTGKSEREVYRAYHLDRKKG